MPRSDFEVLVVMLLRSHKRFTFSDDDEELDEAAPVERKNTCSNCQQRCKTLNANALCNACHLYNKYLGNVSIFLPRLHHVYSSLTLRTPSA